MKDSFIIISKTVLLSLGFLGLIVGCSKRTKNIPENEAKTIIVDSQAIKTTETTFDNYDFKLDDLNKEQNDFVLAGLEKAKIIVAKYSPDRKDHPFDSKVLDKTIAAWRANNKSDKESPEEIIDNLGAAFGQGIVDELNFEWKILTDQYGQDFTVIDKKYVINGFPFSSVEKAVTEENPRSLNDIKLVLKDQVEQAKNGTEVDLRK